LPLVGAFGWSSDTAGIALLTATLPMLLLARDRLVSRLGWRHHFSVARAIMTAGNAMIAIGLAMGGQTPPLAPTICGMIAIGVGVALAHPQLSGAVFALVAADQAGMASAVTVVMRQAGFAIGIAILGVVLHIEGSSIRYVWLFIVAAVASMAGLAAALVLLPPPAASPTTK
jgi:MFS family permease